MLITIQKRLQNYFIIYRFFPGDDYGVLIPSGRQNSKKSILMLDGYTYHRVNYGLNWVCSSVKVGCPSRVQRLENGKILRIHVNHTHEPPRYYIKDGIYIKIQQWNEILSYPWIDADAGSIVWPRGMILLGVSQFPRLMTRM